MPGLRGARCGLELLLVVADKASLALAGAPDGAHRLGLLLGEVRALLARSAQTRLAAQSYALAVQLRALLR